MTAISLATDIPNAIASVEQLHAWTAFLLSALNPSLRVLETETSNQLVQDYSIFKAQDGSTRLFERASIPMNPNYLQDRSVKIWMHANEHSNVVIPAGYKTN